MPSLSDRSRFLSSRRDRHEVRMSRGGHPAPVAEIVTAQKKGAFAVHEHITPGQNPYLADRSDVGRFLALMWFRGYRAEQYRLTQLMQDRSPADCPADE